MRDDAEKCSSSQKRRLVDVSIRSEIHIMRPSRNQIVFIVVVRSAWSLYDGCGRYGRNLSPGPANESNQDEKVISLPRRPSARV